MLLKVAQSQKVFLTQKTPDCPEYYPPKENMLRIVICHLFFQVKNISEIKLPLTQNFHWTGKRGEKSNDSDTNTVTLNSLWKSFVREGFTLGCLVLGTAEFSWKIHVWKLNQKLPMTKKKSSPIEFSFFFSPLIFLLEASAVWVTLVWLDMSFPRATECWCYLGKF